MTLKELAELGEFLGGLGVVLTMIYGLSEYRRHRLESERLASFQSDMAMSDFNLTIARDSKLAGLVVRNFRTDAKPTDFTSDELASLDFMGRAYFHRLEAQWFVSRNRGTPPELWIKQRNWARAYIGTPMGRLDWQRQTEMSFLTPAFIREIECGQSTAKVDLDYGATLA